MPQPLDAVLAEVRELLLGPALVRAVAAGRRRGTTPSVKRAELRPVALKAGTHLQIVTDDGARPYTRNAPYGPEAAASVDTLLAEPFGNWHVQTATQTVQVRVTKKGDAQVHRAATSPARPTTAAAPPAHPTATAASTEPAHPTATAASTAPAHPTATAASTAPAHPTAISAPPAHPSAAAASRHPGLAAADHSSDVAPPSAARSVEVSQREAARDGATAGAAAVQHDRAKQWLLDPGDPLFRVIGGTGAKRRQVDAFLRSLAATLPNDPADWPSPLRVVDLGCGNAYLTFAAYRYLTGRGAKVKVVGVDVRDDQRERNTEVAADLGYAADVRFVAGTIEDAHVTFEAPTAGVPVPTPLPTSDAATGEGAAGPMPQPVFPSATAPTPQPTGPSVGADAGPSAGAGAESLPDLVLALHACDTATDQALARAVRWNARWVLAAPCCHHDIAAQLKGNPAPAPYGDVTRSPILRERLADVLTDSLRASLLRINGYKVDVVEFVDSAHTPRNLLLRARRTGIPGKRDDYEALTSQWGVAPALEKLLT